MGVGTVRCFHRLVWFHPFDQPMDLQCALTSCCRRVDGGKDLHCRGFVCHGADARAHYPGSAKREDAGALFEKENCGT